MAKGIRAQLLAAFEESGMTLDALLEESGLECTPESLGRKLRGVEVAKGRTQPLRDTEIEALARALRIEIRIGREGRAA